MFKFFLVVIAQVFLKYTYVYIFFGSYSSDLFFVITSIAFKLKYLSSQRALKFYIFFVGFKKDITFYI